MKIQRRRIRLSLVLIIALILLVITAIAFKNWLGGYYASENNLLELIRGFYIQYINSLQIDNSEQYIIINYSLPYILYCLTVSIISIVFLFIYLVLRRINKINKALYKKNSVGHIQNLIIDYLYNENQQSLDKLKKEKNNNFRKNVVKQLVVLNDNFIGNKSKLIKDLFYKLELDKLTNKKLNSFFWDQRVRYLRVAATMDIVPLLEKVKENINSNNCNVRDAAQLALVKLNKKNPFEFLNEIKRPISTWQQLNFHHLIERESIPVPKFANYLSSNNMSVVIFSLRMIEAFNQNEEQIKIIKLLLHKETEVRHQALHTIKELNIKEATPVLIEKYSLENLHIQLDIIEALAMNDTEESIVFLSSLLPSENFDINWAILKNLNEKSRKQVIETITTTPEINLMLQQLAFNI